MTKYCSQAITKNIYKSNSEKSEITSQILYGENFKIISKSANWLKISSSFDNYRGFIRNNNYIKVVKNTHKCFNLKTRIYKINKSKNFIKTKFFLPFNSRIKVNINRIKRLPKLKGVKEIMYPGQNKFNRYKNNINKKIFIPDAIKSDIEKLLN